MNIINKNNKKALIYYNNSFYIVSESSKLGLETLIFESTPDGIVTSWIEVGGAKNVSLNEVLLKIDEYMN